jgi:four helix bundle protein
MAATGVRRFEDLVAWQFSTELCGAVLQIIRNGKGVEDQEWCTQIRDAAESAPSLIAEGFVRFTTAEFIRYLRMARGELGEIQNCLHTASREEYFSPDDHERLSNLAGRAMGTTTNLLKAKLRQQATQLKAKREKKARRRTGL